VAFAVINPPLRVTIDAETNMDPPGIKNIAVQRTIKPIAKIETKHVKPPKKWCPVARGNRAKGH
jgi:hypothetical protein